MRTTTKKKKHDLNTGAHEKTRYDITSIPRNGIKSSLVISQSVPFQIGSTAYVISRLLCACVGTISFKGLVSLASFERVSSKMDGSPNSGIIVSNRETLGTYQRLGCTTTMTTMNYQNSLSAS